MSGDGDRPKRSWREIDQMRDGGGGSQQRRPRGRAAEARAQQATQEYLRKLDGLFQAESAGSPDALKELRDAHGTPEFTKLCIAYRKHHDMPGDLAILTLFLDARDADTVVAALEKLRLLASDGKLSSSSSLRTQLRLLAEDSNDEVAEAAEELLDCI